MSHTFLVFLDLHGAVPRKSSSLHLILIMCFMSMLIADHSPISILNGGRLNSSSYEGTGLLEQLIFASADISDDH